MLSPKIEIADGVTVGVLADRWIRADCTAGDATYQLPDTDGRLGIFMILMKTDDSDNVLVLEAQAGKQVGGASTFTLTSPLQCVGIASREDGSWDVIFGNGSGSSIGRGIEYISKTDGNVALGALTAITGMEIVLDLDVAGKVIVDVSGIASETVTVTDFEVGVEIDGIPYILGQQSAHIGSGADEALIWGASGTRGFFLNAGSHTFRFIAAGTGTLNANTDRAATIRIDYPSRSGGAGGSNVVDGDLSGTTDAATVVGIQGDLLPAATAKNFLRRKADGSGWEWVASMGVYVDGVLVARRNSVNLITGSGITLTPADDSSGDKVDVQIDSQAEDPDELWNRSFWEDEGLLPGTEHINEPVTFPPWSFENGSVTVHRGASWYRSNGNGSTIHFSFDTGGSRQRLFFLLGGLRSASYRGMYMSTGTDSNGEITFNSYLLDMTTAGDVTAYAQNSGGFSALTTFASPEPAAGYCMIFDGIADTIDLWIKTDGGLWWRLGSVSNNSFGTMRRCGIRCFSSGLMRVAAPVVIFYDN